MNPNTGQLNDQSEGVPPPPASMPPTQSQSPVQSASDPLGPRPVPPVYDLSQQENQHVPEPQENAASQPDQYVVPKQSTASDPLIPQHTATEVPQPVAPTEVQSLEQRPIVTTTPPAQAAPAPSSPHNQVQQAVLVPDFAASPQGNQNTALSNPNQGPKSKKIILLIIASIGGLLALGVMAFLVMNLFGGSKVKLQKYSDDNFSISYPVGMVVKKSEGNVEIIENDRKDGSKISVIRPMEAITTPANEAIKLYKEQIVQQAGEDSEKKILSSEDTKINGAQAVVIKGQEEIDGIIRVTKLVLIASSDDKKMYYLGFENHAEGIDVISMSDAVLKSFTIKSD
jgi:hypothetical protein